MRSARGACSKARVFQTTVFDGMKSQDASETILGGCKVLLRWHRSAPRVL